MNNTHISNLRLKYIYIYIYANFLTFIFVEDSISLPISLPLFFTQRNHITLIIYFHAIKYLHSVI